MRKKIIVSSLVGSIFVLSGLCLYFHHLSKNSDITQDNKKIESVALPEGKGVSRYLDGLFSNKNNVDVKHLEHSNGYKSQKPIYVLNGIEAIEDLQYPVYKASKFVTSNNEEHLNKISKFKLATGLANNQIGNLISRFSFRNEDYYEALMVAGEGYVRTIEDNVGSTIYHGINLSFQSKETMKNLAMGVSQDQGLIRAYTNTAGVLTVSGIKEILNSGDYWIPPQQSLQFSVMLQSTFDAGLMRQFKSVGKAAKHSDSKAVEVWESLDPNIQAGTRYMVYKLGEGNFGKYKTFINALWRYGLTPVESRTQSMRDELAEKVSFKYSLIQEIDGKKEKVIKEDTRATLLVRSMIASPQAFGYMINEDVKPNFFDGMYKSVSGKEKKFDDDEFEYPKDLKSMMDELRDLERNGYKVILEKNSYFSIDEQEKVQKDIYDWNENGGKPKKRYCISGTTITCR